ncbi:MAG TPA: hypothetical protein VGE27_02015 [Gemmatimonas sp.]|uniref:hypothetical protein n=1 Tax=Gemmatimonas sp. TaxID=1962908 RepID=UPI002EDBA0DE
MSKTMTKALLAGVLLFTSAGCSDPAAPSGPVYIDVASSFARNDRGVAEVPFVVENRGTESVRVNRCGASLSITVERREGKAWETYATTVCPAINPMDPVPLESAARREQRTHVQESGIYRLVLSTESSSVTSASFTVR